MERGVLYNHHPFIFVRSFISLMVIIQQNCWGYHPFSPCVAVHTWRTQNGNNYENGR